MPKKRRMPCGTMTDSVDEYLDAWTAEVQPLIDLTGWTLAALDPNLVLYDGRGISVSLTVEQARDIVNAVEREKASA